MKKNKERIVPEVVICGLHGRPWRISGDFDGVPAAELGGAAIKAAMSGRRGSIDEVLMGNVLPAGQGQAPARQAGFAAGLDETVPATTLNKMCGSGMKTTMIGFDQIALGHTNIMA